MDGHRVLRGDSTLDFICLSPYIRFMSFGQKRIVSVAHVGPERTGCIAELIL